MDVLLYARVSTEAQSGEGQVSIQQQVSDMQGLVIRQGWCILGEFIDSENYIGSMPPNKGKIVNPSGERADRPALLSMLESVKSGNVNAVICWRDDRLVRHPRVAVALEDALDLGDSKCNGRGKVQIFDATGAAIDRFTLSIKATIWREENKRRVERGRLGKVGTLKAGRWPASYHRLGYQAVKEPNKRGSSIQLGNQEDVQTIRDIYHWFTHGVSVLEIRDRLIARGCRQAGDASKKYDWSPGVIYKILRTVDYTGKATFKFRGGTTETIEIPAIITVEEWKLAQKILDANKRASKRNAKDVFLLQGIAYCGECGAKIGALERRFNYRTMIDGSRKRYDRKTSWFYYYCHYGSQLHGRDEHPKPCSWSGPLLDDAIWRKIVDEGIKNPENIQDQILWKQAELLADGDNVDGSIARLNDRLAEIEEERAAYQRMFARKRITEVEFDKRMDETEVIQEAIKDELSNLIDLRDSQDKVNAGLKYARDLLEALQDVLPKIDQSREEVKAMDLEARRWVQEQRRKIIHALVDKVLVYADGRVVLEGVLDGSEVSLFESGDS